MLTKILSNFNGWILFPLCIIACSKLDTLSKINPMSFISLSHQANLYHLKRPITPNPHRTIYFLSLAIHSTLCQLVSSLKITVQLFPHFFYLDSVSSFIFPGNICIVQECFNSSDSRSFLSAAIVQNVATLTLNSKSGHE
jgi:hypothetical protein